VRIGIPQTRRRHVLLAIRGAGVEARAILDGLRDPCSSSSARTVRWAIGDLEDLPPDGLLDSPSSPSDENRARIDCLFEEGLLNLPNDHRPPCHRSEHSYVSMYGRLAWHKPAQTITTGFGSMGQGRFVHPSRRRTITPHEAARLQTFPDWFNFSAVTKRGSLARLIGNAVPPFLGIELGSALLEHLPIGTRGGGRAGVAKAGRPPASTEDVSKRMRGVRRTGSVAEQTIGAALMDMGLSFRANATVELDIPSRPDVSFDAERVAVFVDGCFWHSCPAHTTRPKANQAWWMTKLGHNQERDARLTAELEARGWAVVRIWEHEDPQAAAERVSMVLAGRRAHVRA